MTLADAIKSKDTTTLVEYVMNTASNEELASVFKPDEKGGYLLLLAITTNHPPEVVETIILQLLPNLQGVADLFTLDNDKSDRTVACISLYFLGVYFKNKCIELSDDNCVSFVSEKNPLKNIHNNYLLALRYLEKASYLAKSTHWKDLLKSSLAYSLNSLGEGFLRETPIAYATSLASICFRDAANPKADELLGDFCAERGRFMQAYEYYLYAFDRPGRPIVTPHTI